MRSGSPRSSSPARPRWTGPPIPLESKYASRPTGKDYESLTKAFGRGIMASRRTLDAERSILTVPAGVLLALLG